MNLLHWWERRDDLLAVAAYGVEVGELITAVDVLRFVEKPFNYVELYAAYQADREAEVKS